MTELQPSQLVVETRKVDPTIGHRDKAQRVLSPAHPIEKLVFVDNMRGLGILLVIAVHLSLEFQSRFIIELGKLGAYGVQLFFVASAFTLCLSHDRRIAENFPVINFYIRRYFRIAPVYYIGIIAYGVFFDIFGHSDKYTFLNVLANVFFVHGFVASANNSIVPGGWSIGVEMAFYVVFPAVFPAIDYMWSRWGRMCLILLIVAAIVGVILLNFANNAVTGTWIVPNTFAYFFPLTQAPVFAIGIAYYLAAYRDGSWRLKPVRDFAIFLIALTSCEIILLSQNNPLQALTPTIAALAFVFLAQFLRAKANRSGGILARIGKVSFSIYIMHFAFAWGLAGWALRVLDLPGAQEGLIFLPLYVISTAFCLWLGELSWRKIEAPMIGWGRAWINSHERDYSV